MSRTLAWLQSMEKTFMLTFSFFRVDFFVDSTSILFIFRLCADFGMHLKSNCTCKIGEAFVEFFEIHLLMFLWLYQGSKCLPVHLSGTGIFLR